MDYYLVNAAGERTGPYSLDQMRFFWADGKLTRTTPYWSPGMAKWEPVSNIECVLRPLTPPAAQAPPKTKRKGLGCGSGCLVLVALFGAFIAFLSLLPYDTSEMSSSKDQDSQSDKAGYAVGYDYGVLYYGVQQAHGWAKDSPDNVESGGRKVVKSMGLPVNARTEAVISGYKDGYNDAWTDFQKAKAKALQLNQPFASSTSAISSPPPLPTKQAWKLAVPQNPGLVNFGRIACNRQALFDAVGKPSHTQAFRDNEYLYWDCSDGQIQVICARGQYDLGLVGGRVNDN